MWDAKRQFIWLAAGLALGTFVAYSDAHTEDGFFNSARILSNEVLLPRSRPSLITTITRFCAGMARKACSITALAASKRCGWPFFRNSLSEDSIDLASSVQSETI